MRTGLSVWRPILRTSLACAASALLAAAAAGSHAPLGLPWVPPLPPAVSDEARAAADRALDDPDLVADLARARRGAEHANGPGLEWSVDHGWRVGWDGAAGFDASFSLQIPIHDPTLAREAHDAASYLERAGLDAALHARSAAEELVQARIALWRARSFVDRVGAARALVPHVHGEAAERLHSLLDYELTARFEITRLETAIARATSGDPPSALGPAPWHGVVAAPARTCPEGSANVIRARADLDAAERREEARAASAQPTVRAGVSGGLQRSDLAASPVDLTGRIWLQVGMPRSWSIAGTVRTEVDAHGTEARVSVNGPDAGVEEGTGSIPSARRALERARYEAADDDAYRRHELARTESRLAALDAVAAPADPVDAVERDLEILELRAARTSLLASMAFECAWAP